ncbi:arylamine N-acetyltransferase family protein [Corallococcus macrosporus]|uniref:N-acetyltransferase family protein n=1 Tax=Myxococcus fulvus (strain ATCC BAA-855 / HW-1) TaxID=483219 RepID=F8CFE2_MYXFH|nr:arylamine N-acetyltransferase [Corallococcus macrosporus]AEI62450.1 N-acetyltransferase family protein [Corallococcus macrosporus]
MFDVARYLERIGVGPEPSLAGLHRAHLEAVPFENLDIHLKRPIRLDTDAFFQKVVVQRRGGFCYELNGLFARLLTALGHRVTLLSAGVATDSGTPPFGPDFDHLALQVEDGQGRWLADVGFGECFTEPLRLDTHDVQVRAGRAYRLSPEGDDLVLWSEKPAGWKPEYRLSLVPRQLADFEGMCRYHQTSPDSIFTQRRLCTRATPDGRVTIKEGTLVLTRGGARTEQPLADEAALRRALAEHCGVILPGPE